MQNQINVELDKIRDSLGSYCMNECRAKCCKMGKLLLQNNKEFDLIVPKEKIEQYEQEKIIEQNPKTKNVYFDHEKVGGCQHLKGVMCGVYKNPDKPQICRDFPIFKVGNYIMTSSFCQAVENNILDKELEKVSQKFNLKVI